MKRLLERELWEEVTAYVDGLPRESQCHSHRGRGNMLPQAQARFALRVGTAMPIRSVRASTMALSTPG
ncbi:hypothetical protein [Paraburkholderia sp. J7]|uniref:hypothetical protein n=1 Tax=Paraburkholderia sp. J7 TaxID=2805438 RepID=UPI002AB765DD|nr:hypothetical protein [Paraburkholderia sp. J7]